MRQYNHPDDIKEFGRMVDDFSNASKDIARSLTHLGAPQEAILPVVGRGRYNTLEAQGYVIYGPQDTAAARKNMQGLFGAFYYVHKPELQLSQQAPVLLGKAGCKLVAIMKDGSKAEFPLERVRFYFIPEKTVNGRTVERGKITVRSDVDAVQADGRTATLKGGTVLTDSRTWALKGGKPQFDIIDANGKPLEQMAATVMLWGHVGSMGFKAQGQSTPKYSTLASDGVDDDFTAERHMIEWLTSVKLKNGIDLMPQFNGFVKDAHDALVSKPELRAAFSTAIELSRLAQDAQGAMIKLPAKEHGLEYDLAKLVKAKKGITHATSMLGLELPPPSSSPEQAIAQQHLAQALASAVERINKDKNIQTKNILKYEWPRFIDQQDDPFSDKWLKGQGNTLVNPQRLSIKESQLLKLLGQDVAAGHMVGIHTASNFEEAARTKIVREFVKMSQFLEEAKLDAQGIKATSPMFSTSQGREDFSTTLSAARVALKDMMHSVKDNNPIEDLRGKTETLRAAYAAINSAYGSKPATTEKPDKPPLVHSASPSVSRQEALAQRLAQSNAARVRNKAAKKLRNNTQQFWEEKRSGMFGRFLHLMDEVECDQSRWMNLYRDTSALIHQQETPQSTSFTERVQSSAANTRGVSP